MTKKIAMGVLFFGLLMVNRAQAEGFGYEHSPKGVAGPARLKITTDLPTSGLWLGVTFYAPAGKLDMPLNKTIPLESGKKVVEVVVDPPFANGTFEAAIWGKKLSKDECLATDELCRKNGFRLINMISYLWGKLN